MAIAMALYIIGRLTYTPPKFVHVRGVGYMEESAYVEYLEKKQKQAIRLNNLRYLIKECSDLLDMWYYKAWVDLVIKDAINEIKANSREFRQTSKNIRIII